MIFNLSSSWMSTRTVYYFIGILLCCLFLWYPSCHAFHVPSTTRTTTKTTTTKTTTRMPQHPSHIFWNPSLINRVQPTPPHRATISAVTIARNLFFKSDDHESSSSSSSDSLKGGTVMESQFFNIFDLDDELIEGPDLRYAPPPSIIMGTKKNHPNPKLETQKTMLVEDLLRLSPFIIPILAFAIYDDVASIFATILDLMANVNWVAVDGGAYQAKIIAPAINGVVVPAISILFATLIGTTISTLRQRQLDIRTAINMEAGQLRILQSMINSFPPPSPQSSSSSCIINSNNKCRIYLIQYTSRLIAESQPTVDVNSLDFALDSELNGLLTELNRISYAPPRPPPSPPTSSQDDVVVVVPGPVLEECYTACSQLYVERAKRITALRSLFPPLHFIIVSTLAISICIAFLLESNQVLLVFLNAIQLRILWTMLVGTFSALAIVCYDLGNPFRGSYQISKSVSQLYTIRLALRAGLVEDDKTKSISTTTASASAPASESTTTTGTTMTSPATTTTTTTTTDGPSSSFYF